jgi:hypothetical protein
MLSIHACDQAKSSATATGRASLGCMQEARDSDAVVAAMASDMSDQTVRMQPIFRPQIGRPTPSAALKKEGKF